MARLLILQIVIQSNIIWFITEDYPRNIHQGYILNLCLWCAFKKQLLWLFAKLYININSLRNRHFSLRNVANTITNCI